MSMQILKLALIFVVAVTLAACGGSNVRTSIDHVAKAPDLQEPYTDYLIVGVAESGSNARQFEEAIVARIQDKDTRARGYRRAAERADVSEEAIREIVLQWGIDAILVTRAVLVDSEASLRGGRTEVEAQNIGGSFVDFFRYGYEETRSPPRADLKLDIQFITDVYDAKSKSKVYTMTSTALHAETTHEVIEVESRAIAERLKKDRMIP